MNKVILMGRLTENPELRYTQNQIAVCKFTIAVDRPTSKGQEKQTDFFRITAWRATAETVSRYFQKGRRMLLEGNIQNNNYTDNQGVKHYSNDVHAERVYFADSKRDDAGGNGYQAPAYQQPPASQQGDGFYPMPEDEDLPF